MEIHGTASIKSLNDLQKVCTDIIRRRGGASHKFCLSNVDFVDVCKTMKQAPSLKGDILIELEYSSIKFIFENSEELNFFLNLGFFRTSLLPVVGGVVQFSYSKVIGEKQFFISLSEGVCTIQTNFKNNEQSPSQNEFGLEKNEYISLIQLKEILIDKVV